MAGRQTADVVGAKPADNAQTQGEGALSPQVQAIKEALEKYLRPPMNEVGVSERYRNNIIAYGVNECAQQFDKGVDRIVFAGIHKVKNLVVIETNVKYTSIMYDAIAASKVDSKGITGFRRVGLYAGARRAGGSVTGADAKPG